MPCLFKLVSNTHITNMLTATESSKSETGLIFYKLKFITIEKKDAQGLTYPPPMASNEPLFSVYVPDFH